MSRSRRSVLALAAAGVVSLALAVAPAASAATSASPSAPATGASSPLPKLPTAPKVRIGFFANVTHAPALVAQQLRLFEALLGRDGTSVEYTVFNAGPALIEAMKGGAIDVAYIGPNPSVTGYTTTGGTLLRIVSGAASGGAQFITKPSITTAADLKGKKFATPQLGNTQDVALRAYLKSKGYATSTSGTGDVTIIPTDNATTLALFKKGEIDGAWVPEPWASRLVLEGGGRVFLDEKSLWPNGQFVTTDIIAAQPFLAKYPGTVRSVIQANNAAIRYIAKNVQGSKDIVQQQITKWTGKPIPQAAIDRGWGELQFTWDPLARSLAKDADDAVAAGVLTLGPHKLAGIYDLRLLNSTLKASGAKTVSAAGLGRE